MVHGCRHHRRMRIAPKGNTSCSTDLVKPLVSILIPAYNSQAWIADTIRSATDQTWGRKEIIIVDDGSTDETPEVAAQFASENVLIRVQENEGASAARNTAFSLSQGDYIQWLDADDLLAPDKIERQMAVAEDTASKRTLFSSEWCTFMYRHQKARCAPTALWCDLAPTEWLRRKMADNLWMQTSVWLTSRELAAEAGPWDVRLRKDNDGEYFGRVMLASDLVRFVPGARTYYRVHPESLSYVGRSNTKLESLFLSMQLHIQYLLSMEDSEQTRAAGVRLLQNNLVFFCPDRPDLVEQMERLAVDLGGELNPIRLSWKYTWIQKLFGWEPAKRAQVLAPRLKASMLASWDRALFRMGR